ncbi:hypothetical protein MAR_011820 [Mya arenaria]|uniref:Uncharacterized protein n=1 Tax=Mya arenaria TaxID=6604 RepID=A0ABY7FZ66_MYAAR|nr:hypothetical protein MAR_011820 [Mya arenaria]
MHNKLEWESLDSRLTKIQLTMISIASTCTRSQHFLELKILSSRTKNCKYSFFPRYIGTWNFTIITAEAPDLVHLNRSLDGLRNQR